MPSETCNRIRVERYFLEEAGSQERRETDAHLATCGRCKEQLESLHRERDGYLAVQPYTAFAARRLDKPARALPAPRIKWLPALAGGVALVALVAVLRGPGLLELQGGSAHPADAEDGGVTYKGGESLEFHYRRNGEVKDGRLDETYRAGDELQFSYSAGTLSHVALISVDAAGTVSLYSAGPGAGSGTGTGVGSASLPAKAGKVEPFPFGVTLDDAPGGELFAAVFSQGPVDDAALESWLAEAYRRAGGDLAALQASLQAPEAATSGLVKTLLLRKASP